ncbi:response regulator transcription factor [Pseudomonas sp. LRF_L74]|uniref:response regulator transcription factor n=1 Tax=Pseudomonas sp. LRF_L74 TaxID=3369422 RepID=UPI003F615BB3
MLTAIQTVPRILAIEDDPVLASHLSSHLSERGFDVTLRHDGEAVRELLGTCDFDLILMDILLPGASGLEVLADLRRRKGIPVILMSALGAEQDRIAGFSQGADDYLPKPFSMSEMVVRIEAVLRRVAYERNVPPAANAPELELDDERQDAGRDGQWAQLTGTEYRLLEILVRHAGEVLSKPFLYQQVLHRSYSQHDRSLDMHVSHIRRKLQGIGYLSGRLDTAWGKGYLFQFQREDA